MNQYIITEEDLCTIRDYILGAFYEGENKEKIYDLIKSVFSVIRSHPYQSERDTCPQNKIWQHCPAAEQIRKDARDKVLDDIDKKLKQLQMQWGACDFWSNSTVSEIKDMLKELRQAGR
jgi:hypothetical protein